MASSTPHLLSFPSELIVRILQHLDYVSVHNFELTCRQSHEIVNSNLSKMPKFLTKHLTISIEPPQPHHASDENSGGFIIVCKLGSRRFACHSMPDVIRVLNRIEVMKRLTLTNVNPDILSVLTPVINGPDVFFFEVTRTLCETPVEALVPIMAKISCTNLQLLNSESLSGTALTLIEQMHFVQHLGISDCGNLTFDDACLAAVAARSTEKIPISDVYVDVTVKGKITAEGLAVFLETAHLDGSDCTVNLPTVVGVNHRDALIARLRLRVYEDQNQFELAAVYKSNVKLNIFRFIKP